MLPGVAFAASHRTDEVLVFDASRRPLRKRGWGERRSRVEIGARPIRRRLGASDGDKEQRGFT
jgi:hypothetical protein